MRYVTGTILAILAILTLIFSFQNLGSVDVRFLTWSVNIPMFLIVIVSYLLGMVSGWSVIELLKRLRSA